MRSSFSLLMLIAMLAIATLAFRMNTNSELNLETALETQNYDTWTDDEYHCVINKCRLDRLCPIDLFIQTTLFDRKKMIVSFKNFFGASNQLVEYKEACFHNESNPNDGNSDECIINLCLMASQSLKVPCMDCFYRFDAQCAKSLLDQYYPGLSSVCP